MESPVDMALNKIKGEKVKRDFQNRYNELKKELEFLEHYLKDTERLLSENEIVKTLHNRYKDLDERIKKNRKELKKIIKYYNANL